MFHVEQFSEKVSRETSLYIDLILKWNKKINLVAKGDLPLILPRHIEDSAQLSEYVEDRKSRIADLGAGGGFPGVVLSIMGCEDVNLIEVDERKCVFLREVKRHLSLSCTVLNKDINSILDKFDVCVSRGLGSLSVLLEFSRSLLKPDGYCLFLKGQSVDEEIKDAEKKYVFDMEKYPSNTSQNGVILKIRNIEIKHDG